MEKIEIVVLVADKNYCFYYDNKVYVQVDSLDSLKKFINDASSFFAKKDIKQNFLESVYSYLEFSNESDDEFMDLFDDSDELNE